MKGKLLHFAIVFLFALGGTSFAQSKGRTCDVSGTWVGGSGTVPGYRLTINFQPSGRYSVEYQQLYAYSSADLGRPWFTTWQGEWHKVDAQRYEGYSFFNSQITPEMAAIYAGLGLTLTEDDLALPELDGIFGHVVMLDCNTLQSAIEWFGVYIPLTAEKIAFVTPPDGEIIRDFNGGTPIIEIYHRVGPRCRACSSSREASGVLAPSKPLPPTWHR